MVDLHVQGGATPKGDTIQGEGSDGGGGGQFVLGSLDDKCRADLGLWEGNHDVLVIEGLQGVGEVGTEGCNGLTNETSVHADCRAQFLGYFRCRVCSKVDRRRGGCTGLDGSGVGELTQRSDRRKGLRERKDEKTTCLSLGLGLERVICELHCPSVGTGRVDR